MKKLEIEIPNDKEIDWEESEKKKKIVFKDKQFTYDDVCQKLFKGTYCFIDVCGQIVEYGRNENCRIHPSNAKTRHQLECILAKNKLANVARYLNGEWDCLDRKYFIYNGYCLSIEQLREDDFEVGLILFKSKELAQQAIAILGEETVRLALEPLY